jgi:hypothetical protein
MYMTAVILSAVMNFSSAVPFVEDKQVRLFKVYPSTRACMEEFADALVRNQGLLYRYKGLSAPSGADIVKFCEEGQVKF